MNVGENTRAGHSLPPCLLKDIFSEIFGPNNPITREQLAVMLWRYAGSPAVTNKKLHFNDMDTISSADAENFLENKTRLTNTNRRPSAQIMTDGLRFKIYL